jgi:hypothetical protein
MPYVFAVEPGDMDAMLADSMQSATIGEVTAQCFYDLRTEMGDELSGAAGKPMLVETAAVKTDAFPPIRIGDTVTVADDASAWSRGYAVLMTVENGCVTEMVLQREAD